jgi:hypothetical protein
MGREGIALRTVRLGSNGAWAEGDRGGAGRGVVRGGGARSGLERSGRHRACLGGPRSADAEAWRVDDAVGELRSGESVSMSGQAVGLRGRRRGRAPQGEQQPVDLSGSSCEAACLIGEGLRECARVCGISRRAAARDGSDAV